MLLRPDDVTPLLRCPRTGAPLEERGDLLAAATAEADAPVYGRASGQPVLVDFTRSVLDEADVYRTAAGSAIERRAYGGPTAIAKRLLSPEKTTTTRNVSAFMEMVRARSNEPLVLVVGGATVGQGMQALYDAADIRVVSFDIYATGTTQFVADGHQIPLASGCVDGVVVQAVLEHVLRPGDVVEEIWRVLRPGGAIYAETPFMQQVHEGPYDFTRFTESGHRYLFRSFDRVASGASGGPGIQFMWSVDYLARSLFRSRLAGKFAKLLVFWAQYLDALVPEPYAVDGASGVYFLGTKTDTPMAAREIVAHYRGAQLPKRAAGHAAAHGAKAGAGIAGPIGQGTTVQAFNRNDARARQGNR